MVITYPKTEQLEQTKYYIAVDATYIDDYTKVLNHCDTFGIFSRSGDIFPYGLEVQGLYHRDTRYINKLELRINGIRPTLLSSTIKEENEILSVDLTNPEMVTENGKPLFKGTIHIRRSQFVRDGLFHEKIELENYDNQSHDLNLSLELGGDFKDIFEVRGLKRAKRGDFRGYEYPDNRTVVISYTGLDRLTRTAYVRFNLDVHEIEGPEHGQIKFLFTVHPKKSVSLDYSISFEEGQAINKRKAYHEARVLVGPDLEKTKAYFPIIETSNEQFNHWINRSKADLISLMADTPYGKYPYAGVPWYNTAFGRDGIITALEVLWAAPRLAKDVLLFLASNQATTLNESTDAEPGKILHEMRSGEMVRLNEVPFKQYYGTIDATPLFVLLAGEYYQRTADLSTVKMIWPNIVNSIEWINTYGDIDGDGFIEYQHKAKNGLTNQGWKDSHDSVSHRDGRLADPPIALCEVQAYVYGALTHAANLAMILGEREFSDAWKNQAKELKEKFNKTFWDKELGTYVLALDGDKNPCRVKSSNAGQVLFTGVADVAKAKKLVSTLLKPDLFTGWGIRTLSSEEVRYNPMSYHNGSVWPHDVALITEGIARYGYQRQALQLLTGLFDASLFISLQRLPELFCGMERRKGEGPTAYPVACSPQAWSVASVFLMLKAILQLTISPGKKEISFRKPILPKYIGHISIKNLWIGDGHVNLEITRHGSDSMVGVNWVNQPDGWRLSIIK